MPRFYLDVWNLCSRLPGNVHVIPGIFLGTTSGVNFMKISHLFPADGSIGRVSFDWTVTNSDLENIFHNAPKY